MLMQIIVLEDLILFEADGGSGAGTFASMASDAFALVVNLEGGFAIIIKFPEGLTVGASTLASAATNASILINAGVFS